MKRTSLYIAVVVVSGFLVSSAHAQDTVVYPANGQSAEQMEKDKGACSSWAKKETGVDPVALAEQGAAQPAQTGPQHERLKGAARGAGAGAVVGGIAGDAGKGAAVGAGAGAVAGGARKRNQEQAQQGAAQQQQSETKASLEKYNRAYAACLEGKGYTVK